MKKCLIIFTIAILSIIPISKASASVTYNGVEYPDLPTTNNTDYYTIANTHRGITLIYYPTSELNDYGYGMGYSHILVTADSHYWGYDYSDEARDYINIGGWYSSGVSHKNYTYVLSEDGTSWNYKGYDEYGSYISSSGINYSSSELSSNPNLVTQIFEDNIIYSNISYYWSNKSNAYIYSYKEKPIYFTYEFIDNGNNSYYNLLFGTNVFDSSYKYQIKYSDNWIDISSYLANGYYNFALTKNSILYVQVLDNDNNILFDKSVILCGIPSNKPIIEANYDNNSYYDSNSLEIPLNNNNVSISSDKYYTGNSSVYLKGSSSSRLEYDLNLSTFDLTFYFYKSNSGSYSRLLYLGGLGREVEVKGSSTNMYITTELTTTWKQNAWNKFRITRDSDNLISYYCNDELIFTETSYKPITYIRFGHGSSSTENLFNGYIDSLVLYNRIYEETKEYLTYSANKANDLDGIDIYNFRFNANNYNSNYKYLIKTEQQTEWTDITEELNNEAYQYDYMLYYNTTLYMQVLDENNEVLETKTHTISDLTDYGFKITHAPANDLNDRYINVITIDTRYIYEMDYKYQYSFDNQVFYDMEITEDNKIYHLNHALDIPVYFRVLNASNRIIHEQVYNGDFSNVEKNVIFYESTNISNNEKQIIIQVDFTEYLKFFDMYNFRIWINSIEYDEQTFIKEFISTEENYIKSIKIKIQVDNLTIEDFTYRVGTETGTSGGSDTDFDGMYDNILENQLKNELKENDYTTVNGMVQAVKNFINAISEFVTTFFELIMYFFNKLNIWIRTCIISLFVELVIFKIIKVVRKK